MTKRHVRPRRASMLAVALVLLALGAGGCSGDESYTPPRPVVTTDLRQQDVESLLERFAGAIVTGDEVRGAALDAPGTRVVVEAVQNARMLGVRAFHVRDVDDVAPGPAITDEFGPGARVDTIEVSYRLPEDPAATTMQTNLVLVPGVGSAEKVAAIGTVGARGTLWLEGPIHVRRDRAILLIVSQGRDLDRYWRFARRAARDVQAVVTQRHGPLVFEVPHDEAQLEQLMDVPAGTYRLIAGVTGSVDGTMGHAGPVHSFFNPDLMRTEHAAGGQIVVSHEATLQATRAPLSSLPIWLEEGFADYVPLRTAGLPLRRSARELTQQVRASGPPGWLPTQADFNPVDTTFDRLNAVYESAWLACRLIADRWSEATLLDFYAAVDRGVPVGRALEDLLGVTSRQFVAEWQRYLVTLARRTS